MKPEERCENCRYWTNQGYECHRHAPKLLPVTSGSVSRIGQWPTTNTNDWCGEFRPHPTQGDQK